MRTCFTTLLILLLSVAGFSQADKGTGASTLIPIACPTLMPSQPYDLCVTPVATVVAQVLAPPSASIVFQWVAPAGAIVWGGLDQVSIQTSSGGVYTVTAKNATTNCSYLMTYTVVECPVGIKETAFNAVVSVYPDPFHDRLTITTDQAINVMLIDIFGRQILVMQQTEGAGTLDLSKLPAGVYYLRLATEKGSKVLKLLKE